MTEAYITLFFALLAAYLIGSIPFGYLLVKLFGQKDVRDVGSGGIGATNVVRAGGKLLGALTLLLDAGKGLFVAVLSGMLAFDATGGIMPDEIPATAFLEPYYIIGMQVAVVLGHMYSCFLTFKGGKSFATFLGISIAYTIMDPLFIVAIALAWLSGFFITRISAAGAMLSIVAANLYIILILEDFFWAYAICSLLVIFAHRGNIQRMLNGTENKFKL